MKERQDNKRHHYSYRIYREPEFAGEYESDRFGGRFGRYLKEHETSLFRSCIGDSAQTVLDVGTGSGKLAHSLVDGRTLCIGVDASPEMVRQALRFRPDQTNGRSLFLVADAHYLPFRDRAFDAVISSRVLMHLVDWRLAISEMCRVARRSVTLDYPALVSFPALESFSRRVMARLGLKVQAYRVFRQTAVRRALRANRFVQVRVERAFVLPVALHRWFDSPHLTARLERVLGLIGLRRLLGSPVTVHAVREE